MKLLTKCCLQRTTNAMMLTIVVTVRQCGTLLALLNRGERATGIKRSQSAILFSLLRQ